MKVSEYKQMMAYLTRPGTKKENLKQIIKKNLNQIIHHTWLATGKL